METKAKKGVGMGERGRGRERESDRWKDTEREGTVLLIFFGVFCSTVASTWLDFRFLLECFIVFVTVCWKG